MPRPLARARDPFPTALLLAGLTAAWLAVSAAGPAYAQNEAGDDASGHVEPDEFRTEADDEEQQLEQANELGRLGAVTVPFTMPHDGVATVALYTPQQQLVRILGQAVELAAGEYKARWDGLDLFGNLVPAGTDLKLVVISNPGIRSYYEFTVGHANQRPWGGEYEEDGQTFVGGWLGDHSVPGSATAVGDHVILGCTLAEAGSNLLAVDTQGRVVWKTSLDGWSGPRQLTTDGERVYALHRQSGAVFRIDPNNRDARGRFEKKRFISMQNIETVAAHGGKVYYTAANPELAVDPFRMASGVSINANDSRPQVLDGSAPTEFHISPRSAFSKVFRFDGHPQARAGMTVKNNAGYLIGVFNEPVTFGGVMLSRLRGADRAEIYVLKEGLTYETLKHSPIESGSGADEGGIDVDFSLGDEVSLDAHWVKFAEADMTRPFAFVSGEGGKPVTTRAMFVKADAEGKADRNWRPGIKAASPMHEPFDTVPTPAPKVIFPDGLKSTKTRGAAAMPGWVFEADTAISGLFPVPVVFDYGQPVSFDGVVIFDPLNHKIEIQALREGAGDPTTGGEDDWETVGRFKAKYNKKLGTSAAAKTGTPHVVRLMQRRTTRAIRLRVMTGYQTGKYRWLGGEGGKSEDDPFYSEVDGVGLVKLFRPYELPPSHVLRIADAETGELEREIVADTAGVDTMAFGPGGEWFSVYGGRLCRTTVAGDTITHTPIGDLTIQRGGDLHVTADRIAVADADGNRVYVTDHAGSVLATIGSGVGRETGAWKPEAVHRPTGVAIAADGKVWVAENKFQPKRVSCFNPDGTFAAEYLGPPMYGGGGSLDPDLKNFYYRGMQFELDWAAGTSRLKALNAQPYTEHTPALEASTFSFTGINTPVYHDGRRYIVGSSGGFVMSLLGDDAHAWKPAVVCGPADGSTFLLRKEVWNQHFGAMDLRDKWFHWTDLNDDGQYQLAEVKLYNNGEANRFWGGVRVTDGLTLWSKHWRTEPRSFTPGGVPVYEPEDAVLIKAEELTPHYPKNYTTSGSKSAKPSYFGFHAVTSRQRLIREGQPYVIEKDGSVLGGPVTTEPSGYYPKFAGQVQTTPWKFTGVAKTDSPIGDVALVNSNGGKWFVWAADYGVMVGTLFDGAEGGWGHGLSTERGTETTHRKQSWEGWGGDFIRAHDGNYYASAGKTFHGISRVEGLNDFQLQEVPFTVTPESVAVNTRLRPLLVGIDRATGKAHSKSGGMHYLGAPLDFRTKGFKLDGHLGEWPKRILMPTIGDDTRKLFFDVAYDERGVYFAFAGENRQGNAAEDWREVYRGGFAIDLLFRRGGDRTVEPTEQDQRLVFAKHGDEWIAVRYDYRNPDAKPEEALVYASPMGDVRIDRVTRLPADAYGFKMHEAAIEIDLEGRDELEGFGEAPTLPGDLDRPDDPAKPAPAKGAEPWTAELFLPWQTLGVSVGEDFRPPSFRFDVGVLTANQQRNGVAERVYWANEAAAFVGDPAVEAMITPTAWGHLTFGKPKD